MVDSICQWQLANPFRARAICGALYTVLAANGANAMGISPVLVELSPVRRVASVTLTNPSAQAKTFQAETLSWQQLKSADHYAPSGELLVSPAIAQIDAGQSQVFRIVLRGPAPPQAEQSYRLLLEDITEESASKDVQSMVNMRLRFNLPVFAAPSAAARAVPRWSLCAAPAGKGCVQLDNDGNRRIRLSALSVQGQTWRKDMPGGATVLAGAWKQWVYDQPQEQSVPLRVSAISENGPLNAELAAPR